MNDYGKSGNASTFRSMIFIIDKYGFDEAIGPGSPNGDFYSRAIILHPFDQFEELGEVMKSIKSA
jgi:hypothetical protein